jgi:hypothetical protein
MEVGENSTLVRNCEWERFYHRHFWQGHWSTRLGRPMEKELDELYHL